MSNLFTPLTIREVTLKNRIVISPMCQYSSEDGFANDWHLVHLGSRAVGGAGLIIFEATGVAPEGRISPYDLGIWKDEHVEFLSRITRFIEQQGSVAGIQLAHAGRKASHESPWKGGAAITDERQWETVAPSPLAFKEGEPAPKELSKDDIQTLIQQFKDAAKRSLDAGFKVIELHGAHGYLIHEFLSPISNQRTDEYSGSFENRARFLLETAAAVREVWPAAYPLFVRISATDWTEGGWNEDDSVALANILKENGVDLIDCSTGGNVNGARIPLKPLYQVPFAEKVKKESGILTGAVGLITTPEEAEEIVTSGKADLVLIARQSLRDAYFPLHAAEALGANVEWLPQYERAKPKK
jgi:2,4-dienoyl-CoA reductase-like NADH-dependent reductase (Old Yellow Enzyme family)